MSLTLAAVAAVVAAMLEFTLVPYIQVGGAHPHPVFVVAAIWTVVVGLDGGLVCAFVGGLALDFLAPRPLGSTAFVLLAVVGGAAILGRFMSQLRLRYLAPIIVALVLSFVYSTLLLAVYGAIQGPIPVGDPVGMLLPGAIYDAVLAAIVGPLAVAIRDRYFEQDRVDW